MNVAMGQSKLLVEVKSHTLAEICWWKRWVCETL